MAIWSSEIKELEKLYESFKGQFPEFEKELERLIKADDENMILLYSRRCLEVIITDLCECELKRPRKTEPLKGIIDKLHKEEKVPSHIISSMHGLNELSTYGAHPKDFDPKQVRTTLINLETVIEWYLKFKGIDIKGEEEIQFRGESLEEVKKAARIEGQEKPTKSTKQKLLSGVLITAILAIVVILAYPKIFRHNTLEKLRSSGERISVAVMPFQNMTNDTAWNVWQDGIQFNLITSLSDYSDELKVRQSESTNSLIKSNGIVNYASITPSLASIISQKLDADIFIYGNLSQSGSTIRLNAQLGDSKSEETYKSFKIDGIAENILYLIDSLSMMMKNYLIISKIEKELPVYLNGNPTTSSPEAYKLFLYGENARNKRDYTTARNMFSQALVIDTNFTLAMLMLSTACINQGDWEEARKWSIRVYEKRDQMPIKMQILTNQNHAVFFETPYEELKYLRQYLEIDDQNPETYYDIGRTYYFDLYQYNNAIPGFEKSLEIYHKLDVKPRWIFNYSLLGWAYYETGQNKKMEKLISKADKDFPDDALLTHLKAVTALKEGDTIAGNKYIEQYKSVRRENGWSEAGIAYNIGEIYSKADNLGKAEEYHRLELSLEPDNAIRIYDLGWFLINSNRDINEGLELIDKALALRPDLQWFFLEAKGWGLYKQGKYKESLELLEKCRDLTLYYRHSIHFRIDSAKKAAANQKSN